MLSLPMLMLSHLHKSDGIFHIFKREEFLMLHAVSGDVKYMNGSVHLIFLVIDMVVEE